MSVSEGWRTLVMAGGELRQKWKMREVVRWALLYQHTNRKVDTNGEGMRIQSFGNSAM